MPFVKHTWNKSNKHCPKCGLINGQDFHFLNKDSKAKCFDCNWSGNYWHVKNYCPQCSSTNTAYETFIKCQSCKWVGKPNEFFHSYEECVNNKRLKILDKIISEI